MQSRLLIGFSLIELCFAIVILGISVVAIVPISKVSLSAKNSQKILETLSTQKRILATSLKEHKGISGDLDEFCATYGFGCFVSLPKARQVHSDILNITFPIAD